MGRRWERALRVAQAVIDREVAEIAALIAEHAAGISRAAIHAEYGRQYGRKISTRTMLRRIGVLIARGQVDEAGETNLRIYRAASTPPVSAPATTLSSEESSLPLSSVGMEVLSLIRSPIIERAPTTYDRTFLEAYVPGITWYLPQAMRSRLHHIGRTPEPDRPAGTYAREILEQLLVDLAWGSSRLEGNTYSRLDTKNLIEFGQRAEGKEASEAQMILNHKSAIDRLVEDADNLAFDRRTLLTLHAMLSENLLGNAGDEGRLRHRMVQIASTVYTPIAIPQVIEECFDLFLEKAEAITDPFEQAFFAMVHIPYLQPFMDVNKRTSRVAATLGVYELTRIELLRDLFEWAYERSSKQYKVMREAMGQPDTLRLRYRDQLHQVVHETVASGMPPRIESIRVWGENHDIPAADREGFAERALSLLVTLHEGSAGRYRLRPEDFLAWRRSFTSD